MVTQWSSAEPYRYDFKSAEQEVKLALKYGRLEREIEGALRGIDFTFKSQGINRALTPADNAEKNQNKVAYRDQLNNTAIAIKKLISVMIKPQQNPGVQSLEIKPQKHRKRGKAVLVAVGGILFLVATSFFAYQ